MPGLADLERHLDGETLLGVYALVGPESSLVSEAVTLLRQKALTQAADFNRHEFSAAETPIERVLEAAGTMPMMAPRRFVHLAGLQALKAKDHAPLLAYLERPAAHTVLCLSGEKLDQRTKLGQRLGRLGGLFVLEAPRQQELAAFVERRARRHGVRVELEAAQLLADLVGAEVGSLDRAVEKLVLYAGPDAPITTDDVEAVVAPTRVHSIFELTDAIGARDLGRASLLLRNALDGGESALGVLGMMARQFRQLLQVRDLKARGAAARDISSSLRVPPFLVSQLLAQARHYGDGELERALEAALKADVRLKSSRVSAGVILDRLLVEVVGEGR